MVARRSRRAQGSAGRHVTLAGRNRKVNVHINIGALALDVSLGGCYRFPLWRLALPWECR